MKKSDLKKSNLPDAPGVYIFSDSKNHILYVGKATSLRSRVRSYFTSNVKESRGPVILKMLEEAATVTYEKTDSVLEALILEANLIKKHQPPANTRDKDNKSFNYVVITREEYPRVLLVRGRELFGTWKEKDIKYIFGPFPSGGALKDGLRIVRKIFPYRDACEPHSGTPCFNKQIGLCPGVCSGEISKTQYGKLITHIRLLFEGRKSKLLAKLEKEMKEFARQEKFEAAAERKRQIFALTHIKETTLLGSDYKVSDGEGSGRIEGYDIAHLSETARVGVMVVVNDSKPEKSSYRKFTIRTKKAGDIAALEEVLTRRFEHTEWDLPAVLVIDGGVAQKNAALRILSQYGYQIPIVNVVKNEKHKAGKLVGNEALLTRWQKEILLANTEAHRFAVSFHRQKRRKSLT